jgi:putative transposase
LFTDPLIAYEELSPFAKVRQRKWAEKVHLPLADEELAAIRRSSAAGLPYGDAAWIKRLARRLDLDMTIRPRGRPRKDNDPPTSRSVKSF